MTLSDPIANMLTIFRNANSRGYKNVSFPFSKIKLEICRKMKENAFINDYWFDEKNRKIKAEIKYDNRRSKISLIKKISTPSKLIYLKKRDIFKYRHSKTTFLLSTNLGILTQKEALEKNVGGKLMISIS